MEGDAGHGVHVPVADRDARNERCKERFEYCCRGIQHLLPKVRQYLLTQGVAKHVPQKRGTPRIALCNTAKGLRVPLSLFVRLFIDDPEVTGLSAC